jgi:site-specific recombinase XerC
MLLLTRDAALRARTAYDLRPEDVTADLREIRAMTKWDGSIAVPTTPRMRPLLTAAVSRAAPGTSMVDALASRPVRSHVREHPDTTMRHRLKTLQKRLGLSHWTWHDLRRTAAQQLYKGSGDLRKVQSLLGHKSIVATLHYLNAQRASIAEDDLSLFASAPTTGEEL